MKKRFILLAPFLFVFAGCFSSKQTPTNTNPKIQRIPAQFDFSPPSRVKSGSLNISMAMVKPTYVGKNPEYFVSPFKEMAMNMASDFDELLTAKGFTIRGPFGSRDEMTYNDKINSGFILEIGIELNPQYNRRYTRTAHSPSLAEIMINTNAPTTYTYKMSGQATLGGNLVIKAKSSQYGELLWTKSIALDASSFELLSQEIWKGVPTMQEELKEDNLVYNTLSRELEKIYAKALGLAWQQIDPVEMKVVADEGKKADKRGAN